MTKEQEAIEKIDKKLDITEDKEVTINLLYKKIELLEDMLKEKDKEIEELKKSLARNIAKNFTSSMKESAKSKEDLEILNKGWQIELEKKDKQIKFMANFINDNTPYTKDTKELENEEGIRTLDFTVKYFERKSKE